MEVFFRSAQRQRSTATKLSATLRNASLLQEGARARVAASNLQIIMQSTKAPMS